jgi:AcrR family transcriptional regulator
VEAGFARATFYLHFRDKGEMVARIMGQLTEELIHNASEWLVEGSEFTPATLRSAIVGTVATFKKHQAVVAAILDTAPFDETVATLYHKMIDSISKLSQRSYAVVRKQGRGRAQTTDEVIDMLTWMVFRHIGDVVRKVDEAELDALSSMLGHICVSTVFSEKHR